MDGRLIIQSDDSYKWIVFTPVDGAVLTVQLRDLRATTWYPIKHHD